MLLRGFAGPVVGAMTTIDINQLVAVAFIQAGDRKILQAAPADVAAAGGK